MNNAATASNVDSLITAALNADDFELVWWAREQLGLDADALLVSDRSILSRCATAIDYAKARRTGCTIRISRRGRVALWALYRLLPAYRVWRRATEGTHSNSRFEPDFSGRGYR